MRPVQDVASSVLAEIVRRQPASRERTAFAWSIAVGPALARATTIELRDGILYVTPKDSRWTREIERARDTILVRLHALLGAEVSDIVVG
jgi:predicted nucleic acid-binding Zn ribbon protein